ncbi:MAG: ABC transporter permease [Planctomycetes bacterium]|nr:ABC transporter permease [Planctomycetota bacterium]MCD7896459.1 ABC transporter permease [Planctomycetaceae bacterium]
MIELVTKLIASCVALIRNTGAIGRLLYQCIYALFRHGIRFRREIVTQIYFVGVGSLPVVIVVAIFAGAVFAYAIYNQMVLLGVGSWAGVFMAKLLTWHFGPVLMALVLAGRVGCSFTAELGTMNVTDQTDALRSFGLSPTTYLIMPRLTATFLMMPVLTIFAVFIGVLSGLFMIVTIMGGDSHFQWVQIKEMMIPYDYIQSMIKSTVFGILIALICCRNGLLARGGAEGVGSATTEANVAACTAILVVNLVVSIILTKAEPLYNSAVDFLRVCLENVM